VADAKVVDPSDDIESQFVDDAAYVTSPAAGRDLTYPQFESLLGFCGPDDFAICTHLKTQEGTLAQRSSPALGLVDHQFQGAFHVTGQALDDPLGRLCTCDHHDKVIGIAGEQVSARYQGLVEWVQHDIGQQR
jgi:hypothetical protein